MATEPAGPVDVVVLRYPETSSSVKSRPALRDLVVDGIVRVIDLLFIYKDEDGGLAGGCRPPP
jgi:hypothetical protein